MRICSLLLPLAGLLILPAAAKNAAKPAPKDAEYKAADSNFYLRSDVVKSDPTILVLTPGDFTQKGDSYFLHGQKKTSPKEIYLEESIDWVEPITPPSMPTTLGVAPDAMQLRELQGDVQIALPGSPANFSPAQDGTTIPNGAVIKTGADGTVAVLFGGVNSARFFSNSEGTVSQTVVPTLRSTMIDLKSGSIFAKVGTRVGDPQKQDYEVHTFSGIATAKGTDFVVLALPTRTDVWVELGTVTLAGADGKVINSVTGDGTGPLKGMRIPPFDDAIQAMSANTESLTSTIHFIPTVNLKLKSLHDEMAKGTKLSANEKAYLKRIKKVPYLIKLALVEPPPPPAIAVPAPPPVPPTVIASAPPHAKHMPPPPKLDTRPVPSPAPNASPTPLPPVETGVAHTETPAATPAPAASTPAPEAPAAPAPTTATVAPTPVTTPGTPAAASSTTTTTAAKPAVHHHKKTVTASSDSNSSHIPASAEPIASGPNDTVP